jgi:serine/threonine protein phosphatase PrpC
MTRTIQRVNTLVIDTASATGAPERAGTEAINTEIRKNVVVSAEGVMRSDLARIVSNLAGKCMFIPALSDAITLFSSPLSKRVISLGSSTAIGQHQGSRAHQEDVVIQRQKILFTCQKQEMQGELFGICDGHGDEGRAARFVAENLNKFLRQHLSFELKEKRIATHAAVKKAITDTVCALAKTYQQSDLTDGKCGGTTLSFGLKIDDTIYFGNSGDSRAILVTRDSFFQVTEDDKPDTLRCERLGALYGNEPIPGSNGARIRAKGDPLSITLGVGCAVSGHPWVPPEPQVTYVTIAEEKSVPNKGRIYCNPGDLLLFLSDGITNRMTNEDIVDRLRDFEASDVSLEEIAKEIAAEAAADSGSDNCTLHIVRVR